MSHILVLQNSQAEGIGSLDRMMKEDGFDLDIIDAKRTVPDKTYDALVVLGGPQSANDKEQYLRSEEDAILRHADAGVSRMGLPLLEYVLVRSWQLLALDLVRGAKDWDFTICIRCLCHYTIWIITTQFGLIY